MLVKQSPDTTSLSSLVNATLSVSSCSADEKQILQQLKTQNLEAIQSIETEMNAIQTAVGGNIIKIKLLEIKRDLVRNM